MFEYDGQNATKITSALTDTCIQFPGPVMSDFGKDIMFVLGSYDHVSHSVLPSSFLQAL